MTDDPRPEPRPLAQAERDGAISRLAFLCGADMNPSSIRARGGFEAARFLAIARTDGARVAERAGLPAQLAREEIWGIVLAVGETGVAQGSNRPEMVPVILRNGTSAEAMLMTNRATVGTIAELLAEAHYWELPMAYRDRLERLAAG